MAVRRTLVPLLAFLAGSTLMTSIYLGVLMWLQDWRYALFQFTRDGVYVVPIIIAFGIQSALYAVIRLQLQMPVAATGPGGALMGASGGTSATAMVACCLHHASNVLPLLGLSAATAFLARYQRPFMLVGLAMNVVGILIMLRMLYHSRQELRAALV